MTAATHVAYFDTLAYANKLKKAGVPSEQAEVQAEALLEVFEDRIATKYDLDFEINIVKNEINTLRNDMNIKFSEVYIKISETKNDLIKWMISISLAQSALIISLLKFFH